MASHCQRVIILKEGKVVESGTFAELAKSGRHFSNIFDPDQNNWLHLPPSDH
jgi:ABC-type multidrug transport system fused ATPase/permease subunit